MPDHIYNLYEAKTHLSQLVDRAAKGEEILIAKAGLPLAKLVPLPKGKVKRKPAKTKCPRLVVPLPSS